MVLVTGGRRVLVTEGLRGGFELETGITILRSDG